MGLNFKNLHRKQNEEAKRLGVDPEKLETARRAQEAMDWAAARSVMACVLIVLENATRIGNETDEPEGARIIQLSDTLASRLAGQLRLACGKAEVHLTAADHAKVMELAKNISPCH